VLVYGSETWPLKIGNIGSLGVFERRILRETCGPTKEGDEWHIGNNKESYELYIV
jgi:hypothetical protein